MQTLQSDYFSAYHNLKLTRDAKGVLVAEFHGNGGPLASNRTRRKTHESCSRTRYE